MLARTLILALGTLCVSACATPGSAPRTQIHSEAEALSALLLDTARSEPARIARASAEMTALRQALLAPPAGADAPAALETIEAAALEPAPDLTGARSILSAVHLASYRTRDHAMTGWSELQAAAPEALTGLEPRLSRADLGDRGVFLRLKAGPIDSPEAARALCGRLESAGLWCAPSDFNGEVLNPLRGGSRAAAF